LHRIASLLQALRASLFQFTHPPGQAVAAGLRITQLACVIPRSQAPGFCMGRAQLGQLLQRFSLAQLPTRHPTQASSSTKQQDQHGYARHHTGPQAA
jgi:hypothetical protein